MVGQQMTLVAVPFQVYALTGDSLMVGVTSVVVDFSSKIWRSEFFATTRLFNLECRKGRLMAWLTAVGGAISV